MFKLVPNKFITQNEIDAANQVHFDELNVQNQPKVVWPAEFRSSASVYRPINSKQRIPAKRIAELEGVIAHPNRKKVAQRNAMAEILDAAAAQAKTPADAKRMRALAAILKQEGT